MSQFETDQPTVPVLQTITKPIGGEKNGGERTVIKNKGPKWYPADDVKKPVPSRKHVHKPTKLRSNITPGTVLILLNGAYRGSRVIFLKQLSSGLLLVTGPFSINRVPLKRVEQAYVISTAAKVDISGADVAGIDDAYFKRFKKEKKDSEVMEVDEGDKSAKPELPTEKIETQKKIDAAIVPAVEKVDMLSAFLKSKFTLKKGQYPHEMKF